jgi:hypothetical protein
MRAAVAHLALAGLLTIASTIAAAPDARAVMPLPGPLDDIACLFETQAADGFATPESLTLSRLARALPRHRRIVVIGSDYEETLVDRPRATEEGLRHRGTLLLDGFVYRRRDQEGLIPWSAVGAIRVKRGPGSGGLGGALFGMVVYPLLAAVEPRLRAPFEVPGGSVMLGFAVGAALGAVMGEGGEWATIYPDERARRARK